MSPKSVQTIAEKTTVPWNAVAEIYQQHLFFYFLVSIKEGEEVGYELKDDINIDYTQTKDSRLIQVKHTILTGKEGSPKNLTEKDIDLWHTISNWVDVVMDPQENRTNIDDQLKFIENTRFELYTNKTSLSNTFFKTLRNLNNNEITIEEFRKYLTNLLNTEKNGELILFKDPNIELSETDKSINKLLNKKDLWLKNFLMKISVCTISNLSEKIFEKIKDNIPIDLSDKIFENAYATIINELINIIDQKGRKKKITVSYDEFRTIRSKAFKRFIDPAKYEVVGMDYREIPADIATNPQKQTFIKQLLSIEDIEHDDIDLMRKYTSYRYAAEVSLKRFYNDEAILDNKLDFKQEKLQKWDTIYRSIYRKRTINEISLLSPEEKEDKLIDLGYKCLSEIRKKSLTINQTPLSERIANGHFYWLSDIPEIGWRMDWENYKNNNNEKE